MRGMGRRVSPGGGGFGSSVRGVGRGIGLGVIQAGVVGAEVVVAELVGARL